MLSVFLQGIAVSLVLSLLFVVWLAWRSDFFGD
jgi:hypothetical protein